MKKLKSKTPAQDRLQSLVVTNKALADSLREMVDPKLSTQNPNKRKKLTTANSIAKKSHTVTKNNNNNVDVDAAKSGQPNKNKNSIESDYQQGVCKQSICESHTTDEIPSLFPPKNPAQNRLEMLQQQLSSNEERVVSEKNHDAVHVFRSSFGISDTKETKVSNDMDEEMMDWEPSNNGSPYSFQQIEDMVVEMLTDSAYIVPDTNVFIDSLASIKSIIEKGQFRLFFLFPIFSSLKDFFPS